MRKFLFASIILITACAGPQTANVDENVDVLEAANTRVSLGLTYLKNGNFTQAKFNLDKARDYAPKLANVHYGLAYYYQKVGENALAEQAYMQAMTLDPDDATIANSYGAYLCQQGNYQSAKVYFLQAVAKKNYLDTAETYENLALCSQSQGRVDDAISYLRSALNHQPGRTKSLIMMAELLVSIRQWESAKQHLRQYEKIANISPKSLWLAMEIEKGLGNDAEASGYGRMLTQLYPDDIRAKQYLTKTRSRIKTVEKQKHEVAETAKENVNIESQLNQSERLEDGTPYHTVQKNENLYRISLMYNIKMKRLIEWNSLPDAAAIFIGKKLRLTDPSITQ